ncbi:fumarylacetoacetate hydrolase family protein [Rhodanobacter hydrolyticus]|uniref:Fumarylacetoacetate hydrolase family protein n=1 Tax=Rhodanobacter hydrolyticus TaxID=2250595 RepID=A0ABW8JA42_9GAMM
MNYVIAPPVPTSLPVLGDTLRFPIRRVFCIGRNYAEHAKEMSAPVESGRPMFFCKPADAVVADGKDVPYPTLTNELHHEVEMVLALGAGGRDVPVEHAAALVWGVGVGLDLTRRDLQAQAKAKGHPWDVAKAFDHSAPVSALRPVAGALPGPDTELRLTVNGAMRQHAPLGEMIHDVPHILAALSTLFELQPGDLVFTGTPAGVAALERGDHVRAELAGYAELDCRIV